MVYPAKLSAAAIADAAIQLVDEQGVEALGIRPVAERLGVRPASLYKYCGDLLGLQAMVAEAAAKELLLAGRGAIGTIGDATGASLGPTEAVETLAQVYLRFASERPALYALLTLDTSGSALGVRQPVAARRALWDFLLEVVGARTGQPDDTDGAVALWSFLHGFATLRAAGLFGASGPRDGLTRGIRALVDGV
jgi:AcrR family transcriptional regulator